MYPRITSLGGNINQCGPRVPKKRRLGPQNSSRSSGCEKLLKIVNCATIKETEKTERDNCGGPNGIAGWPPKSTWIR